MSSSLARKLQREIKGNPLKAGVLGVLFVVAIWFWIPLCQKWFGGTTPVGDGGTAVAGQPSAADATAGSLAPTPATQTNSVALNLTTNTASPTDANRNKTTYGWQRVTEQIDADKLMRPALGLKTRRDPFGPSANAIAAEKAKQDDERKLAARKKLLVARHEETTPAAAGLRLASTIIRNERSVAMINGQVYYQGSMVPAGDGGGEFVVDEILPRAVVLERRGKRYQLALKSVEVTRKAHAEGVPQSTSFTSADKPNSADHSQGQETQPVKQ